MPQNICSFQAINPRFLILLSQAHEIVPSDPLIQHQIPWLYEPVAQQQQGAPMHKPMTPGYSQAATQGLPKVQ